MKSALPKIAVVALVIASLALLYSANSSAWMSYLQDPACPEVLDEYHGTVNTTDGETIELTPTGSQYWRKVDPGYLLDSNTPISNSSGTQSNYAASSVPTITFKLNSPTMMSNMTSAPPLTIPDMAPTVVNNYNSGGSSNGTVPTGGTSGGSKWYPTVVNGGTTSTTGTTDTTGTTGSGGVIVILPK